MTSTTKTKQNKESPTGIITEILRRFCDQIIEDHNKCSNTFRIRLFARWRRMDTLHASLSSISVLATFCLDFQAVDISKWMKFKTNT